MRIAVEVVYDPETQQYCMGMVSPPWIASCGETRAEARRKFLEAFRAYFEPPSRVMRNDPKSKRRIELVTVA